MKMLQVKLGSKGGVVVRALTSHQMQCDPDSTPGIDAICGLSLLLVLSFALRGFSPGTPVFPSPQKPTLPNSNSIWNTRTHLNEFIWSPKFFVGKIKKAIYNFILHLHFFHWLPGITIGASGARQPVDISIKKKI